MKRRRRHGLTPDVFAFDLASVETYLVATRVLERATPGTRWYPVSHEQLTGRPELGDLDADRLAAERRAAELDLPLFWPDRHPAPVPRAMRAARYAAQHGFAGPFMQTCARLAFAGTFDLDGRCPDAIDAAAGRIAPHHKDAVLAAANDGHGQAPEGDPGDAAWLVAQGIERLPALRIGGALACGERAIHNLLRSHT